jgi:hypothetical protein
MDFCTLYFAEVKATPIYYQDSDEWELDDIALLGNKPVTLDPCPWCSIRPNQIDEMKYEKRPFEDLRKWRGRPSWGLDITWEKGSRWKVRVPIPHTPAIAGVDVGSTEKRTSKLKYQFEPGTKYQPYESRLLPGKLPLMWAFERGTEVADR